MKYKAVIFDMDGLMFDTERLARGVFRQTFTHFGYEMTDGLYLSLIGSTLPRTYEMLQEHFGESFPVEKIREMQEKNWAKALGEGLPSKPGLSNLMVQLTQANIPLAVASSSPHAEVVSNISRAGLLDHFAIVVGADLVAQGKPAPDLFLLASRELGVSPSECVVLEDSEAGIRAADAAGMAVIMVPDLVPPSTLTESLTLATVSSLVDVIGVLQ